MLEKKLIYIEDSKNYFIDVQKKLFSMGYKWFGNEAIELNDGNPFYIVTEEYYMYWCENPNSITEYKEGTIKPILDRDFMGTVVFDFKEVVDTLPSLCKDSRELLLSKIDFEYRSIKLTGEEISNFISYSPFRNQRLVEKMRKKVINFEEGKWYTGVVEGQTFLIQFFGFGSWKCKGFWGSSYDRELSFQRSWINDTYREASIEEVKKYVIRHYKYMFDNAMIMERRGESYVHVKNIDQIHITDGLKVFSQPKGKGGKLLWTINKNSPYVVDRFYSVGDHFKVGSNICMLVSTNRVSGQDRLRFVDLATGTFRNESVLVDDKNKVTRLDVSQLTPNYDYSRIYICEEK